MECVFTPLSPGLSNRGFKNLIVLRQVQASPDVTRCECRQLTTYDNSVSARELFVDIVALSEQVFGSFLSVLGNRKGWTMADVAKNIFVFITIGKMPHIVV